MAELIIQMKAEIEAEKVKLQLTIYSQNLICIKQRKSGSPIDLESHFFVYGQRCGQSCFAESIRKVKSLVNSMFTRLWMVGTTGFEPAASWSQTRRDTKLRHVPKYSILRRFYS